MAITGKTPRKTLPPGIAKVLKRLHYPLDAILLCVRWYVAYSLSLVRPSISCGVANESQLRFNRKSTLGVGKPHRRARRIVHPLTFGISFLWGWKFLHHRTANLSKRQFVDRSNGGHVDSAEVGNSAIAAVGAARPLRQQ
jgi:hypothetical protein